MAIPINPLEVPELPDDDEWQKPPVVTGNTTFTNYYFPIIRAAYPNITDEMVTIQPMTTTSTTNTNVTFTYTTNTNNGNIAITAA